VGQQFAAQPLVEASVRNTLALCYDALGFSDKGLPHAIAALEIRRRIRGSVHADVAESLNTLATLRQNQGPLPEAERLFRGAVALWQQVRGNDGQETVMAVGNLGLLLTLEGQYGEAESHCRNALDGNRRLFGSADQRTLIAIDNLVAVLDAQRKLGEAEPLAR